ncbi:hypothetical protein SAMN05216404_104244 [Nitrosospira multiformis]|uniref:Uncharacterized protein n=1 Tax=Nitrosospira multiformis TaxID=1231 RepID=A0A1H8GMW6_9PROT|nr:hypothetical protein SAMN05216404_104244 [Nitrosospira multiformis]
MEAPESVARRAPKRDWAGRPEAKHEGPAKRDRAVEGRRDRALCQGIRLEEAYRQTKYTFPRAVALQVQSRERSVATIIRQESLCSFPFLPVSGSHPPSEDTAPPPRSPRERPGEISGLVEFRTHSQTTQRFRQNSPKALGEALGNSLPGCIVDDVFGLDNFPCHVFRASHSISKS